MFVDWDIGCMQGFKTLFFTNLLDKRKFFFHPNKKIKQNIDEEIKIHEFICLLHYWRQIIR
jgi:hypothetical protein